MRTRHRVRRWDELFENAQSRKTGRLSWVPVPNKHDGKSFRRLMALPNGPAIYGAWILTLQVASKCPERGVLADADGPLTAEDLAVKTDCPESLFHEVFAELSTDKIPWLEVEQLDDGGNVVAGYQSATSELPEHSTGAGLKGTEQKGTEQKGTEQKGKKRTEQKKVAADAAGVSTKSRKKPAKAQEPVQIPDELNTPAACKALDEFRQHRRQLKKPLTALAENKLLTEWSVRGADRFVAAVDHSISNGWQGVFESDGGGNAARTGTARGSGQRLGRVAAPAGKYDDDSDVIDLTDGGQAS